MAIVQLLGFLFLIQQSFGICVPKETSLVNVAARLSISLINVNDQPASNINPHAPTFNINQGGPLTMGNGVTYDEYVVLHPPTGTAPAIAEYALDGQYNTFSAVLGLGEVYSHCVYGTYDVDGTDNGDSLFKIYVDDQLVYSFKVETYGDYDTISIDVTDADVLRIEAEPLGAHECDFNTFANPILSSISCDRCGPKGIGFQIKHACQCQSSCSGQYCKTMERVAEAVCVSDLWMF
eukprot:866962_1